MKLHTLFARHTQRALIIVSVPFRRFLLFFYAREQANGRVRVKSRATLADIERFNYLQFRVKHFSLYPLEKVARISPENSAHAIRIQNVIEHCF